MVPSIITSPPDFEKAEQPETIIYSFYKRLEMSRHTTEYFLRRLGDLQDVFWQMWDESFLSFLISRGFLLGTLPWRRFYLFIIVESWTLTLTEASEGSSFHVVLGSFGSSWMNHGCVLGVILVGSCEGSPLFYIFSLWFAGAPNP